jgi:hypothetical protein
VVALKRLAITGLALLIGARLLLPSAPPLYDGFPVPVEPYHYVCPAPALASTNKPATPGEGDIKIESGSSRVTTVQTQDAQVLAFFPAGSFKLAGQTTLHVRIVPLDGAPAPPTGSTYVGNVYAIVAGSVSVPTAGRSPTCPPPVTAIDTSGQPAMTAAAQNPVQVLMRVPPIVYTSVRLYYDRAWHEAHWGAQQDSVSIALDHLGVIGVFSDPKKPSVNPPPKGGFPTLLLEIILAVVALGLIIGGVVAQRIRANP